MRSSDACAGATGRHTIHLEGHGTDLEYPVPRPGSAVDPDRHARAITVTGSAVDLQSRTVAEAHSTNQPSTSRVGVGGAGTEAVAPAGGTDEMRILIIAPPGVSKRTQGAVIVAHFNIPHIAIGELLRDHIARRTDLGRAAQAHLDRGELVPDKIVLDLVRQEFTAVKAAGEYVLAGMPRTLNQALEGYKIALDLGMTANVALHLKVDEEELIRRLLARAALERRSDDTEDVIRDWLELYHQVTHPIIGWYAQRGILMSVDAMRPARQVGMEIIAALEAMRPLVDHVPEQLRRPVDLSGLGTEFGPPTDLAPPVWDPPPPAGPHSVHADRDLS
jgi:adenylate kinase